MEPCSLALALLLDASGSVGPRDWRRQVEGHARALETEVVRSAITLNGPVAVRIDAFSDHSRELVGWTLLQTDEDITTLVATLRASGGDVRPDAGTFAGAALQDSERSFQDAPCVPERRIIDLVTDGVTEDRFTMRRAREELEVVGIRVNALFVETPRGRELSARAGWDDGIEWLREEVVTGGGIAMSADGWDDFTRQIRSKVTLEVAGIYSE
jgi:hypothetical protein